MSSQHALSSLLMQELLSDTLGSVYTAPGKVEFTRVSLTNVSATAVVATLYHRPEAVETNPGPVHAVAVASVPATTTLNLVRDDLSGITLKSGDELWAATTTGAVTLTVYGVPLNIAPGVE